MKIPYECEKKRIIILDKDLDHLPKEKIQAFMKRVIGRHYHNLNKKGPGYSFSIFHEPALKEWIETLSSPSSETTTTNEIAVQTELIEEDIGKVDQETQTDTREISDQFQYKFDVDPIFYELGRRWMMG